MRKHWILLATAILAAATLTVAAQTAPLVISDRKITLRVTPIYPDLAKRMNLHGMVRVEAVVRANGSVKSTKPLGGSPVLVEAAQEAVAKWKFEPGPAETTEILQLAFESKERSAP